MGEMSLGSSAEQGPVLKPSLSQAPCLAAREYVNPSEPACPETLLAHAEWGRSSRVWFALFNGLLGCRRLHSISRHPDTSPGCCRGPQGL